MCQHLRRCLSAALMLADNLLSGGKVAEPTHAEPDTPFRQRSVLTTGAECQCVGADVMRRPTQQPERSRM